MEEMTNRERATLAHSAALCRSRGMRMIHDKSGAIVMQVVADHELKIDPERLWEIIDGYKSHEVRVFDRNYQVGQFVHLKAYDRDAQSYTGEEAEVQITAITEPGSYGLPHNVGVLSIRRVDVPESKLKSQDAAVAAIQFALKTDEGLEFLRCWNEGDFDAIRREWSDAPEAVFIGADPLHPQRVL